MGYDIYIKECSTPLQSVCKSHICKHKTVDETYLSYNFNKFKSYWSVEHNLHQHRGKTILKSLEHVISRINIPPVLKSGQDYWTASLNVFVYHLHRFKTLCEKYPNHRFYADCMDNENVTDTDSVYDFSQPDFEDEYFTVNAEYIYTHPEKGHMVVDTFEKAAEVYVWTLLNEQKGYNTEFWLEYAKTLL